MTSKLFSEVYSSLSLLASIVKRPFKLLLAVSGGSDSVALLYLMDELKYKFNFSICVVTVNHNIREAEESRKDAEFVKELCSTGFKEKIECVVVELPRGKIEALANLRKKGIEEAARFVRYRIFEKAKDFFKADYVLTAHTRDDFYEGVLLSFLNGSSLTSLLGMKMKRGYYIKPLLNVEKEELKAYLLEKDLKWREDSTNHSLEYFRNKVRLILIPALTQTFAGWKGGVCKTLSRLSLDEKYITATYNAFIKTIDYWRCEKEGEISCRDGEFLSMPDNFKIRFLQEGFILLKIGYRVTCSSCFNLIKPYNEGTCISYSGITLSIKNGKRLLQKKELEINTKVKNGYMIWVEGKTSFSIGKQKLIVKESEEKYFVCSEKSEIGPFSLPFCIRSRLQGDVIKINGKEKSVKTILSKFKLSLQEKELLPIIESGGEVKALYGGFFGLKNLIAY